MCDQLKGEQQKSKVFSRAHLKVAAAVIAVLGFANCLVFNSLEGFAIAGLGPFLALYDLPSGRFDWDHVFWPLVYAVAAIFALGILLQFVGRARAWQPITRLLIWAACWLAWCVAGDLSLFAMLG
jgi:hypothetical protein